MKPFDFDTYGYRFPWDSKQQHGNIPEVGWIDIHDRKPEAGTEIIGLYAYGLVARFLVESESSFLKEGSAEYCKVNYWMPMPEVPEEYR